MEKEKKKGLQDQETQQEEAAESQEDTAQEESATERSETEQLQEQYNELNDRYLRLMAEYDNFRKRSSREKEDIYPSATASAVEKFLPILDTFERAAQYEYHTEDFAKGFDMLLQNFRDVLDGFGVEAIGETGEKFDPDRHNAVMHIEDESLGENVVAQVLQKGYKIGDRIIRYAMVQTAN